MRAFVRERGGGRFAFGLDPDGPDAALLMEATRHPVFRLEAAH